MSVSVALELIRVTTSLGAFLVKATTMKDSLYYGVIDASCR